MLIDMKTSLETQEILFDKKDMFDLLLLFNQMKCFAISSAFDSNSKNVDIARKLFEDIYHFEAYMLTIVFRSYEADNNFSRDPGVYDGSRP